MIVRSMPLVLAAAIALTGCQAPMPGATAPVAAPAADIPAGQAATSPAGQAAAPVNQSDVRTFSGVATFGGEPLAGYDVRLFDAVTGQPVPLVDSFLGNQAQRYTIASINGGAGPAALNIGLKTDSQGVYSVRLSGFALGQAVKVVISKGDVALETIITADQKDLSPVVTNEVDDSYLVRDAEAAALSPNATSLGSLDQFAADPTVLTLDAAALSELVTDDDVNEKLVQRAIERGELDPAHNPEVAGYVRALEADTQAEEALVAAEETAMALGKSPSAPVVAEGASGASGYVLLSNGLFAHRSLLATSAQGGLTGLPSDMARPTGTPVKGPQGEDLLEVTVEKFSHFMAPDQKMALKREIQEFMAELAERLDTSIQEQVAKLPRGATTEQKLRVAENATTAFTRWWEKQLTMRPQPGDLVNRRDLKYRVILLLILKGGLNGRPAVAAIRDQLEAEAQARAEKKEQAIKLAAAEQAQAEALKAYNLKTAAAAAKERLALAEQKQKAAETLLEGKPPMPAAEREEMLRRQAQAQAEQEAKLKAAGVTPKQPVLVDKPDGTTVALVEPQILRQVNEQTTTQAKLIEPVLQTSRVLAPQAAATVLTNVAAEARTLGPELQQTLQQNPALAHEIVNTRTETDGTLDQLTSDPAIKKKTTQVITTLVSQIAQQSQNPANRSAAASDPAVIKSLEKIPLPGTLFVGAYDPTQGSITLTRPSTGQAIDAASPTAVTTAVSTTAASFSSGSGPAAVPVPTIASLSTKGLVANQTLTITGTNFSTTPASNAVSFNGTAATPTAATATTLTVTVPAAATSGSLTVTVNGQTSGGASYHVYRTDMTVTSMAMAAGSLYGGAGAGLAIDTATNKLYVARNESTPRAVARYNPSTGAEEAVFSPVDGTGAPVLKQVSGVAVRNGMLYVADGCGYLAGASRVPGNQVVRINLADNTYTILIPSVNNPSGLAFDSAGNLCVASFADGSVNKYNADTGALLDTMTNDLPERPLGIALDASDNLYVTGSQDFATLNGRSLYKATPAKVRSLFYEYTAGVAASNPHSLAVDAYGHVWATFYNSARLIRIAPDGTAVVYPQPWATNDGVNGVAIDTAGNVYVYGNSLKVYKLPGAAPAQP